MAPNLFRILLVLVVLYSLWRGGRDERLAAFILLAGVVATLVVISPVAHRFSGVETPVMFVDMATFAGFLWVALRSDRFWPLWLAGIQLTTVLGHLMKLVAEDLLARAYGAALVFWSYPLLLIIAVGTWRSHRRSRGQPPQVV